MNSSKSSQCVTYIGRFVLIILLTFVILRIIFISHEKSRHIKPESVKKYPLRTATIPISKKVDQIAHNSDVKRASYYVPSAKSRNRTASDPKVKRSRSRNIHLKAYNEDENVISPSRVVWESFIATKMEPKRTSLSIPSSVLSTLSTCPNSSSIITNASQIASAKKGCTEIWSDSYIMSWRKRLVSSLCEENANSKIKCFDSKQSKSRFCIFENAMMNFRKVRKRKVEGNVIRSWERGFLSADCGDMAPDDIGYLPLYKPDIEGRESAVCDYTFNETVLVYSHENTRNFHSMAMDYLTVWITIWAAGLSKYTHDITLLNMDGLRNKGSGGHGRYYGDVINQFFLPYNTSFRRILRAAHFADSNARVCFKQLIVQPRPSLPFHQWGGGEDAACPPPAASSLFQRFNLQLRHSMGMLPSTRPVQALASSAMDSGGKIAETLQILLVLRSLRPGQSGDQAVSRIFRRQSQLIDGLQQWIMQKQQQWSVPVTLIAQDLLALPYEDQLRLIGRSSIVIGMHGAGTAAASLMMPVGRKLCCGLVEIVPAVAFPAARGYIQFAKRMGHVYEQLIISGNTSLPAAGTEDIGSEVTVAELGDAISRVIARILEDKGSCLLQEVLELPYL